MRSFWFNTLFYLATGTMAVLLVPFVLLPRQSMLWIVRLFVGTVYWLEKHVAGLDYEIRGLENLPPSGTPFLLAAKHQSSYETFKLHILFRDPAIVLKRELTWIPFWGWFLAKSDPIAIDRSNRDSAMTSLLAGARRMKEQVRPIVIFPQGTRTGTEQTAAERPYKGGIVKMQAETGLPIVPLALNSGMFWPRKSHDVRPGRVVFEFLPPIPPGLPPREAMTLMEERLESASNRLMLEAKTTYPHLAGVPTAGEKIAATKEETSP